MSHLRLVKQPDILLTKQELAATIKFSTRWIEQQMHDPHDPLPHLRYGRAVRFRYASVQRWLDRRGVAAA